MKLKDIKPNPNNPRVLRDDKFQKLKQSITEFPKMLSLRPMVIDENNVVLGGNMRLRALQELGFTDVDEAWVKRSSDLTEEEKKRFIIADNVAFGEWDWDTLANDWEVVDLEAWGLEIPQFDNEAEELEASEDDYDVPEGGIETDIVIGDLFEIGEHRLLCGDSTDSDAVARLMNGEKADLCVTDPPYGVNYNPKWREELEHQRKGTSNGEVIKNDDNADWESVWALCTSNVIYVWHAPNKTIIVGKGLENAGFELKYLIIWNKDLHVLSRGDYHWKHEVCWYAVRKNTKSNWQGDRTQNTVWDIPTIHSFANGKNKDEWNLVGHGNQKPLECMLRPIKNNSTVNSLILDFFLGSGSTMVAAHQLKRRCYGMELEPKYCAVIIDRMAKLDPSLKITRNGKEYKTV